MALAVRYGKPVVAYVDRPSDIPGLPAEVPVEPDFLRLKAMVRAALAGCRTRAPGILVR